ncbi:MAG: hypothetical protein ACOYJS_05685 [Acutalibacteraceae bacterium]|jgi:hypothetical protein
MKNFFAKIGGFYKNHTVVAVITTIAIVAAAVATPILINTFGNQEPDTVSSQPGDTSSVESTVSEIEDSSSATSDVTSSNTSSANQSSNTSSKQPTTSNTSSTTSSNTPKVDYMTADKISALTLNMASYKQEVINITKTKEPDSADYSMNDSNLYVSAFSIKHGNDDKKLNIFGYNYTDSANCVNIVSNENKGTDAIQYETSLDYEFPCKDAAFVKDAIKRDIQKYVTFTQLNKSAVEIKFTGATGESKTCKVSEITDDLYQKFANGTYVDAQIIVPDKVGDVDTHSVKISQQTINGVIYYKLHLEFTFTVA